MKTNTTNGQFRHRSAEERKRIVQHPMHTSWRFVSSSKTVRLEGVCGESETPTAALRARWPNIVASHTGHASSAKREISNSGPGKACRSAPCQIAEHRGTPYWSRVERKKRDFQLWSRESMPQRSVPDCRTSWHPILVTRRAQKERGWQY